MASESMNNIKDDRYYINKVIENIDIALQYTNGITLQILEENTILQDSVMFRFVQIAENAQELSDEFIEKNNDLPWHQLNAIRNRIVHAYDIIRLDIIYDTIMNDLKSFKEELLRRIII